MQSDNFDACETGGLFYENKDSNSNFFRNHVRYADGQLTQELCGGKYKYRSQVASTGSCYFCSTASSSDTRYACLFCG